MRESVYHQMAAVERDHWWFVGRRRIIEHWLKRLPAREDRRILELGCGSGGNFEMLARYGQLYAADSDETARNYASALNLAEVEAASLPDDVPYPDESFDLVVMLDVLEHIADDAASLQTVHRLLKPGGWFLATVPAFGFLWSAHDEVHHHHRRYDARQLRRVVEGAPLQIQYLSCFNVFLFPLIAAVRLIERRFPGRVEADLQVPPAPLNSLLRSIFAAERHLMPAFTAPWGVSLLLVGRRYG